MKRLFLSMLLVAATLWAAPAPGPVPYDVVVYGATAGGVMTAVSASRMGLRAVILEPRKNVGGMASGGLQRTDVGRREVIGGIALEFYFRAGLHYETMRMPHEVA